MITISPEGGSSIEDAARKMVDIANRMNESVSASFNGAWLTTNPGGDPDIITRRYGEYRDRVRTRLLDQPRDRYQRTERVRRLVRRLWILLTPAFKGINTWETQDEDERGHRTCTWTIGNKHTKIYKIPFFQVTITREVPVADLVAKGKTVMDLEILPLSAEVLPILNQELDRFSRGAGMRVSLKQPLFIRRGWAFSLTTH